MTYKTILLERDELIARVTLNRPEKLNALSDDLLEELGQAFDELKADPSIRVVILQGAGRAFCAGYDLSPNEAEIGQAGTRDAAEERERLLGNIELFTRIWRHPVPVIAKIHGYSVGGGSQLATFCDITIAAEDAVIMASPTLMVGGGYLSPLWVHQVGPKRAKLMSYDAGRRISGRTAADWGWASEAVPADELDEYVEATARSIARTPASVLRLKKEALNRVVELEGFLTYARTGAETDAILHHSAAVQEVYKWITTDGLKPSIDRFTKEGMPYEPETSR